MSKQPRMPFEIDDGELDRIHGATIPHEPLTLRVVSSAQMKSQLADVLGWSSAYLEGTADFGGIDPGLDPDK